ncbi:MAG: hypothetical protein MHM6MM_009680 [Cercozoa sp. M6MM]
MGKGPGRPSNRDRGRCETLKKARAVKAALAEYRAALADSMPAEPPKPKKKVVTSARKRTRSARALSADRCAVEMADLDEPPPARQGRTQRSISRAALECAKHLWRTLLPTLAIEQARMLYLPRLHSFALRAATLRFFNPMTGVTYGLDTIAQQLKVLFPTRCRRHDFATVSTLRRSLSANFPSIFKKET